MKLIITINVKKEDGTNTALGLNNLLKSEMMQEYVNDIQAGERFQLRGHVKKKNPNYDRDMSEYSDEPEYIEEDRFHGYIELTEE